MKKLILSFIILISTHSFAKKHENCLVYRLTGKVSKEYKHCERVINKRSSYYLISIDECKPEVLCYSENPHEATPKDQLEKGLLTKLIETFSFSSVQQ